MVVVVFGGKNLECQSQNGVDGSYHHGLDHFQRGYDDADAADAADAAEVTDILLDNNQSNIHFDLFSLLLFVCCFSLFCCVFLVLLSVISFLFSLFSLLQGTKPMSFRKRPKPS